MGSGAGSEAGRRVLIACTLTLMLVALWPATHRYQGVSGDAELYAVQALAKLHAGLAHDMFLQDASQDKFTIFSAFYAWCMDHLGMRRAALVLAMLFKTLFFVGAWVLARILTNGRAAFMAVALIIITPGIYGSFGVFRYSEDWLTARSLAEALVVCALVLHFYGFRVGALLVGLLALFVHPLMAFPGLLVLSCLWFSLRVDLVVAAIGLLATLGIAFWAVAQSTGTGPLTALDPEWTEIVRERSVFLFLQHWRAADWMSNARPFLSLTLSAMVISGDRVRKLCLVSMLVGAVGLLVAFIASNVGPVAILIQGQSWRWEWITCFVGILLVAQTTSVVYRDARCGPLCALLLIAGWTLLPVDGTCCVALALLLWLARKYIDSRAARYLRWAAGALALGMAVWITFDPRNTAVAMTAANSSAQILAMSRIRGILALQTPAVVLTYIFFYAVTKARSVAVLALLCLLVLTYTAWTLPASLKDIQIDGVDTEMLSFADWRKVIPPASNVFVAPAHNSAAFAWFTLERPSYLTVTQSAGVVFSRVVAMEVKRRSQVLLPLMQPDWRLLTGAGSAASGTNRTDHPASLPLTAERLVSICQDTQLDFVVAQEYVGFDPLRHLRPGPRKDWNLYDCRHVRSLVRGT